MNPNQKFCRACWYGGKCLRFALVGSFKSATNWGGILGVGLLGFALQRYGRELMPAETWTEIIGQGLFFLLAAWVVIFFVRLLASPFMVYREGKWYGDRFVYREPKLAFHEYVSRTDNNKVFHFRFADAPPFSLIHYKFDFDPEMTGVSIVLMAHPDQWPDFEKGHSVFYTHGSIRVGRKRDLYLKFHHKDSGCPLSIMVYVTGWSENES